MEKYKLEVKKVRRKGAGCWIFSFEVARKRFACEHTYASERSCLRAAENFLTKTFGG